MSKNISKFGALLAVFALFASLMVSIPVGAAPIPDIYLKSIGIPGTQPTIGDNISLTATIRATNSTPCKNVTVTFYAVNGTTQFVTSTVLVGGPVKNTGDWIVNGSWDSTKVLPDGDKVYKINVTLSMAGETNLTNNTRITTGTIDWMAPKLAVNAITGPATALIGDVYSGTVTVKNIGDAPFNGNKTVKVDEGLNNRFTGYVNASVTPIVALTGTKDMAFSFATTGFTAGIHNFTSTLSGVEKHLLVNFSTKVTDVYVTGITFTPTSVKGTQIVTINATLLNEGTLAAVNMPVHFWYNTSAAKTPVEITSALAVTVNVSKDNVTETTTGIVWATPTSTVSVVYTITVTVDNSFKNKTLTVLHTPLAVLGISSIAFNPTALVAKDNTGDKQNLTITATVINTGDKLATNAVLVFSVVGTTTPIYTNNTVNVTVGGSTVVSYTYSVVTPKDAALLNFTATVTLGTASASNWKNISVPGHIYKTVLVITELTANVPTQEAGLPVTFTATVKNTGDLLAQKIDLTFLAGTTTIGTKSLYNLTVGGAGNTTTIVTWTPAAAGKFNINVTITATNYKNITYTVIVIKKPSVVVEFVKNTKGKVVSYSSTAADGKTKTLKVQVTLVNSGNAEAKNLRVDIKNSKGVSIANATGITVPAGQTVTQTIEVKMKAGTSTKLTADILYDGIHGIAGIDKGLKASSTVALSPTAKVVKTPGFEGVILVGAVAVALVVLSRRKKN